MATDTSLSVLDTAFLFLEDEGMPMHLASMGILEGGPLLDEGGASRLAEIRALVSYRLEFAPRLRQRAHPGLWHQAPPAWEDDKSFDISHHVWEWRLPAPGDEEQLREACGELLSQPLDRSHPLWELILVTGLSGDRVAIVEKLHHSMADGLSTAELATVLLDFTEDTPKPHPDYHWVPGRVPTADERAFHDLTHLTEIAFRLPAWIGWSVAHPIRRARSLQRLGKALFPMLPTGLLTLPLSLNRQIGPGRAVHFISSDLDEVHAFAQDHGVTVNDVVLTAVTGGMRAILAERNELGRGRKVQAVVPVGLEGGANRTSGNKLSAYFVPLPVSEEDPLRALGTVSSTTKKQKQQHREDVPIVALRLLDPTPQGVLAGASHLLRHQPVFNLVVTNVPGPPSPLYLMGARLLEAFPIVPLLGNQGLSVAVLSYDGQLTLGVYSNPDVVPDITVFCDGVWATLARLGGRRRPAASSAPGDEAEPRQRTPKRKVSRDMADEVAPPPVVVGMDGSEPSVRALRWAARQAAWMHAPLEVVTAWTFPEGPAPFDIPIHEPYQDELITTAQAKLDETVAEVVPEGQRTQVHAAVIRGSATEVLLAAAETGALLVVGRRGCGRFEHALMGSVSERCARHANCPVVVVR